MIITALLTGKKNSTFKNKNVIKLHGEYIFNYPAKQAKKVKDINFFYTSSDINPWTPTQQAVNRSNNWAPGRTSVYFEGNNNDARVMIRTCYKNPCSGTNRKQERINID